MGRAKQDKTIKQLTVSQFESLFPDETACKTYLVAHRWPQGVHCPRCGNAELYDASSYQDFHWQCRACAPDGYRFSVLVDTIFENTNKPLKTWFRVIHAMLTAKKGVSALQIYRTMDIGSYKTAWYMCHRIRAGLADEDFQKLMGIVEVDETFVGGLAKNRHKDKRGDGSGGTGGSGKAIVAGAVQRKGNVVARVIENVKASTLTEFVRESVSTKVSLLCTDQYPGYRSLDKDFPHSTVDHAAGEYVVGPVHTQTIEGFWSLVKRGMIGTFHRVSKKYLPLYVAEFRFRYNNRQNPDIFGEAIKGC
ncbi:MAG: IS1595 family transposase [Beijerinckiaceae bacterium]|nr:IS1595 family transposase [Beijerinckiaceae bacterium]